MTDAPIPALTARGPGTRFVFYGDSCSGVPGALHEATHARVNAVVRRLDPPPEFIVYPGDEIIGLVPDADDLRAQWRHWFDVEMAWLDRDRIPLYHATGNHTTWDRQSEDVFREVMAHLPRNGAPGQDGLSYFVRRGDLLLVFVHTLCSRLGGEGHVETEWLDRTLAAHPDARWKFVVGHHPAFPVNGFSGPWSRTIGPEHVGSFWDVLTRHGVFAYLCSHILAFDVQCHRGVLQITSAGAGTAHRMPEETEYLHAVQMALDGDGLRYQVLDPDGTCRECLSWPPPPVTAFAPLAEAPAWNPAGGLAPVFHLRGAFDGRSPLERQTILSGGDTLWIGLAAGRLTVTLQPVAGRSPHYWFGPDLSGGFDLQLMLHPDMGPGGLLWRQDAGAPWTSLDNCSSWGLERLPGPVRWTAGQRAPGDEPFLGTDLAIGSAAVAVPRPGGT